MKGSVIPIPIKQLTTFQTFNSTGVMYVLQYKFLGVGKVPWASLQSISKMCTNTQKISVTGYLIIHLLVG
jgi:hypothetical protein